MDRDSLKEIDKLLSFLPKISSEEFQPVKEWLGDEEFEERTFTFPFPQYDRTVNEFFEIVWQRFWQEDFDPKEVRGILEDTKQIQDINLDQIKSILTYFARGERFCDGLKASAFEDGHIRRLLERLAEIRKTL